MAEGDKRDVKGNPRWPKGVSGNPKGRPPGLKDKYTEVRKAFIQVFEERGLEGLKEWAAKDPSGFYKTTASLMPKEVDLEQTGELVIRWKSAK